MTRFIKLTTMLLNTNNINKILIKPNKYYIHIMNKDLNGFGFIFAGTGWIDISSLDYESKLMICETIHPIDNKIVSEWIDKISNE